VNREPIPVLGAEPGVLPRAPLHPLDGLCVWLSWALPLGIALWSLRGEASFRDDLGVVRDLGFARVGSEGVVSTLLTQVLALLPLGGRALRASLLGVLALGLASRCFFGLVRGALDRHGRGESHALLALLSSSIWALGPGAQSEAVRVGGALPAVALVLLGLWLGRRALSRAEPAALAATGLVLGAALAESHAAGASLSLVLASLAAVAPRRAWVQGAWRFLGAAGGVFFLLASLRWFWPTSAPALPLAGFAPAVDASLEEPAALRLLEIFGPIGARVRAELGGGALGLACAGAALASGLAPLRRVFVAWALPLALAAVAPVWFGVPADCAPIFALLSSLGVTAFLPVALQALVRWAWSSPLPLARPGAVLSLTFASTLVLSRVDQALLVRPLEHAAAAWADEALGRLPSRSLLLVQSNTLALRLLASRTLHGTRPDVSLVPVGLLGEGSLGLELARSTPSVSPLLRQLWVNGVADEYSLSRLADERPVFVELDASWDRRLLQHLIPEGLWLGYSAPALGASERRAAASGARAMLSRVLAASGVDADPGGDVRDGSEARGRAGALHALSSALDRETRRALGDGLAQQALSLASLAERDPALRLLRAARRVDPDNPLAVQVSARLSDPARARAVAGLLE
jgi:hypothetical protein